MLCNGRFAHVVENEAVSRKLIDERNDFGELMGIDKKIVDKAGPCEMMNSSLEVSTC